MAGKCVIVTGGEECDLPISAAGNYIVACDKGYDYCKKNKIIPDLLVGDFDSYSGKLPEDVETITLPTVKDDTDTMYAIKEVIKRGFDTIILTCALGNRLDHTYANFQACAYAAEQGVKIAIIDKDAHIYFVHNSMLVIDRNDDFTLSAFSYSDVCRGVTIEGAKYSVKNGELRNTFPLGQSNEWLTERVYFTVEDGTLMVIMARVAS